MMFAKVNAHTVKCVIGEEEITTMGYQLEDICKDQNLASEFMKNVIGKANEAGFEISEHIQAVQVAFLPNHQLVLMFMEGDVDEQVNQAIANLLNAANLVDSVGKERLEEIQNMTGDEKQKAFEECVQEVAPTKEIQQDQVDVPAGGKKENADGTKVPERYILCFHSLNRTEDFCKITSVAAPGQLYKSDGLYYLVSDLTGSDDRLKTTFLTTASEYAKSLEKDILQMEYLKEHGEVLIAKDPITILKNL